MSLMVLRSKKLCVLILYLTSKIGIQPKLKVSQPGDVYEQEADRVAEQVMRRSDSNSIPSVVKNKEERMINVQPLKMKKKENLNRWVIYSRTVIMWVSTAVNTMALDFSLVHGLTPKVFSGLKRKFSMQKAFNLKPWKQEVFIAGLDDRNYPTILPAIFSPLPYPSDA